MVDWNKEVNISWKLEIVILLGLYLLAIAIHYGCSFLYVNFADGWTQMQIFGFLAWMTTMVFIPMSVLFLLQNINESKENPINR